MSSLLTIAITAFLGLLLLGAILLVLAVGTAATLPDRLNRLLRRVGLAGPSPVTRAAGIEAVGVVDEPFVARDGGLARGKVRARGELWDAECDTAIAAGLTPGDRVRFVYRDELVLTVLGREGD